MAAQRPSTCRGHAEDREAGFTLVELLVVILIIAMLATIAVPSFLNQRTKGQDACAKSQVRTMQTAMETYYTDYNTYSNASLGSLNAFESAVVTTGACGSTTLSAITDSPSVGACGVGVPGQFNYCVTQQSAAVTSNQHHTFSIAKANGQNVHLCTPAGEGGCSASGSW